MKQRVISALVGIPILVAFVWFETCWFPLLTLLVAAFVVLGVLEFYRLANLSGARPATILGVAFSLVLVINAHLDANYEVDYLAPVLLGSAVALPLIWLYLFSRDKALLSWAWTLAGILYMGWMIGHYVSLRELDQGRGWVILAVFSTFACDTSAFLIGRKWGRYSLAPRVSPGKTWEGAVAGFLAAPAAALVIYCLLDIADMRLRTSCAQVVVIGCLIGFFAQLGDLFESLLKRRAGVKDSGKAIPGHGGVLDRIDSLVFSGAVVYYYVLWVVS